MSAAERSLEAALAQDVAKLAERRFVTVIGAAFIAECSQETIRRALRSGELHGSQQKKSGTWKMRPACVEAWVDKEPCEHQGPAREPVSLQEHRLRSTGAKR